MIGNKEDSILKRVHLFPNALTAFSLSCGLFIIFTMLLTTSEMATPLFFQAITLVFMIAGVADLLDGTIARLIGAESEFGVFFDSVADSITFGVAPSVMVLKSIPLEPGSQMSILLSLSAMIFSICGVLRLVRFSVSANHLENKQNAEAHKKNFIGLPIPAAAAAIVSTDLFLVSGYSQHFASFNEESHAIILSFILIVLGYFMISRWKFPSLKTLRLRVETFQLVLLSVVIATLILYGVWYHFPIVFLSCTWGYVLLAWLLSVIRLIAGRKSKTLIDFEPAKDQEEIEVAIKTTASKSPLSK